MFMTIPASNPSAAGENAVDLRRIRLVVHDGPRNLHPRVSAIGKGLDANHELGWDSCFSEEASGYGRALQAKDLFEVKGARKVDGAHYVRLLSFLGPASVHGARFHSLVQTVEVAALQVQFKLEQFPKGFRH
jgi:hypothetical protein